MKLAALVATALLFSTVVLVAAPSAEAARACILNADTGEFACVVPAMEICRPGSWCYETPEICIGTLCS